MVEAEDATKEPDMYGMPSRHRDQSSPTGEYHCGRGLQGLVSTMGKLLLSFEIVTVAMGASLLSKRGIGRLLSSVMGFHSGPLCMPPLIALSQPVSS